MRFLLLTFAAATAAKPNPSAFCSVVDKVVTAVHQQTQASAFCSSYLHIPVSTSIVSATATFYSPACKDPNAAAKRTPSPEAGNLDARRPPVAKPSCFKSYSASAVLSSACSCLSVAQSTTTTTTTVSTTTTSLTFSLRATGGPADGQYSINEDDGRGDGLTFASYTGDSTNAATFFFDSETPPALYVFRAPDYGFAMEDNRHIGPLEFLAITDDIIDENIESVHCTVSGGPGVCTVLCSTFAIPGSLPSPYDGFTVSSVCGNDNVWNLNSDVEAGCSAFTPVIYPVAGQAAV